MTEDFEKPTHYLVRILDLKYRHPNDHLDFYYIYYIVKARQESDAIIKARELYMKGEKG